MDYISIDFETANSNRSSACALGIVVVEYGKIKEKLFWFIRPKNLCFDPFNTFIHGICEEDVVNEPEFDVLWPTFRQYLENKLVIAHNASFDMSVLRHVMDEYEIQYPELTYCCTRIISKKTWPGLTSYKLDLVARYLGIDFQHHNPVEDAFASMLIAQKASEKMGTNSISDLINLLEIIPGSLFPGGYNPARERKIKPQELIPTSCEFITDHPFFQKELVFTGTGVCQDSCR